MAYKLKQTVLRLIPYIFSDRVGMMITKLCSKSLKRELEGVATDKFLRALLKGMHLSFYLSKRYRRNIKNFEGKYLFRTADNTVVASATFANANMEVHEESISEWDVRVTFKDTAALRGFLFSKDQDIIETALKNEVEAHGNLNYIYKFGFLARDLTRRLGFQYFRLRLGELRDISYLRRTPQSHRCKKA